jgi:hypothetical protein
MYPYCHLYIYIIFTLNQTNSKGIKKKFPVIFIPGIVSTGLEVWEVIIFRKCSTVLNDFRENLVQQKISVNGFGVLR